jgi:TRAP transporter TAXI family solute receptor
MRHGLVGLVASAILALAGLASAAESPPVAKTRADPAPGSARQQLEAYRDQVNAGMVGIVSGGIDGTYLRVASELASVLDNPEDGLRVLPVAGKGSLQNVWDLVFARGIDVALVQSDVLAYAKREKIFPRVELLIQYICHLYDEEVHILASRDIHRIEDLAGKKVNFDGRGSGTWMTASMIFGQLGIEAEPTHYDQALALEKLKSGEIAAAAFVVGKPARLFANLPPDSGLHFLDVPQSAELKQTYQQAELTSEDYPKLLNEGETVSTVKVSAVMAVYAWSPDHERYRKAARFVDAFFSHAAVLQQAPRHPKWRELSLAENLPGWVRFPPAERWLHVAAKTGSDAQEYAQFMSFLEQVKPGGVGDPAERDALFAQYVQWRGDKGAASGSTVPPKSAHASRELAPAESGASEQRSTTLPIGQDAVRQVQAALKAEGVYRGPIDGVVGPSTTRAIGAYQKKRGLPQSSTLDPATLRALTAEKTAGAPAVSANAED